ncbi:MBL fold metallo-hydrolase [Nocardioides zeae]|uniref:MBL fold metallo-hydrolase n=1 Tax=Nocardioides imazamoxiresistens TaxID=3231893 RepID=A0ABU3PQG8_9ACTN|nr:MBL fold metallo-hydrolase [Nocardioides zeae]MDT9591454.1 MBL fold metallo-hydrolase [Nocardioides zeae]
MSTRSDHRVVIRQVAPGLHRVGHDAVNFYLAVEDGRVGLVDAGLPASWPVLEEALRSLGHAPPDVVAVAVTHAHFDHLGCARRLQTDHGVPVLVHPGDAHLAAHPYRYRPARNRFLFAATHRGGWPHLAAMTRSGALGVRPPLRTQPLTPGALPDFPGRPEVVVTPGHTDGHVVLHFPRASAVVTGDALVTLDPYTGLTGPRVVASGATNDPRLAVRSLEAIAATGAMHVLPGHGEPWHGGAALAAERAALAGVA